MNDHTIAILTAVGAALAAAITAVYAGMVKLKVASNSNEIIIVQARLDDCEIRHSASLARCEGLEKRQASLEAAFNGHKPKRKGK